MKFSEMTYTRPDINALLARCKQLAAKAADAQDGDALIQVYYEQSRAFADYTTASQLANIHYTCDTRDAYWKAEQDFFDANGPAVTNASVEISRAFLANPYVDALTEHFGTTCVAGMKNAVLGMDDRTVELQQEFNALVSQYQQIYGGALVELDGAETVCHVKNTGRCRELLVPGAEVYLVPGVTPGRRTPYDLVAVNKGGRLINMDAQAPNRAFAEFARTFDPQAESIRPEFRFGESRLDFCLTRPDGLHLVEVKGVTLEQGGHARFPDAPTERGVKHVHELIRAVEQGCRATAFFVIQMAEVVDFAPNDDTHPAFGAALRQAREAGVSIAAYSCRVAPDAMYIDHPVPVVL